MNFKAGKGFSEKIYVRLSDGDFESLSDFLGGENLLSVSSYGRVVVSSYDLYGKDKQGDFEVLDNKDDFKFDLKDSKIRLYGELGEGNDLVKTSIAGSTIDLGNGRNVFRGGDGEDGVQGGSQADTIHGGGGNDVIRGGGGKDVLSGGKGNDYFSFEHFDEFDARITDFQIGKDVIELNGWSEYDLKIKNSKEGAVITHIGDEDRILLEGVSKGELADFDKWLS